MTQEEHNQKEQELLNVVFLNLSKLSRHRYFNDELWRKLEGRKYDDKADIQAAFMSKVIYENLGIPSYPAGICWAHIGSEKSAEKYYSEYDDIWKDYIGWCIKQR